MIDLHEVVTKLNGSIYPIGETQADDIRYENLEALIVLIDRLLSDIDNVYTINKRAQEFSKKRAAERVGNYFDSLGIKG
jgi:hypothetical protein